MSLWGLVLLSSCWPWLTQVSHCPPTMSSRAQGLRSPELLRSPASCIFGQQLRSCSTSGRPCPQKEGGRRRCVFVAQSWNSEFLPLGEALPLEFFPSLCCSLTGCHFVLGTPQAFPSCCGFVLTVRSAWNFLLLVCSSFRYHVQVLLPST